MQLCYTMHVSCICVHAQHGIAVSPCLQLTKDDFVSMSIQKGKLEDWLFKMQILYR